MSASFDDEPRFEARGGGIIALLRLVKEGVAARIASGAQLNAAEAEVLSALSAANQAVWRAPELPDFRGGNGEYGESVTLGDVPTAVAADLLDRSPRRVRQLAIVEEVLRFRRVGGRVEVALDDVERLLEERA